MVLGSGFEGFRGLDVVFKGPGLGVGTFFGGLAFSSGRAKQVTIAGPNPALHPRKAYTPIGPEPEARSSLSM